MIQSELFEDLQARDRPKRSLLPVVPGHFLRLKVAYEDAVFMGLSMVLVVLAGFCLGVERGKRLTPAPDASEPALGLAVAREPAPRAATMARGREPEPRKMMPSVPVAVSPAPARDAHPKEQGARYVIQLASYRGFQSAQEEAKRLARKGVRAEVVRQGRLVELRSVGYRSEAEAKEALAGLRKTYRDAFAKRLSSG